MQGIPTVCNQKISIGVCRNVEIAKDAIQGVP